MNYKSIADVMRDLYPYHSATEAARAPLGSEEHERWLECTKIYEDQQAQARARAAMERCELTAEEERARKEQERAIRAHERASLASRLARRISELRSRPKTFELECEIEELEDEYAAARRKDSS